MEELSKIHVRAKNFKSFDTVEFSPSGLNIIIGTNASGKSNLFDLFKFLDSLASGRNLRSLLGGSDKSGLKIRGSLDQLYRKGTKSIEISFSFSKDFVLPFYPNPEKAPRNVKYRIKLSKNSDNVTSISEEITISSGRQKTSYDCRAYTNKLIEKYKMSDPIKDYEFSLSRSSSLAKPFYDEVSEVTNKFKINLEKLDEEERKNAIDSIEEEIKEVATTGVFIISISELSAALQGIEFLEPDPSHMRSYNSVGEFKIGSRGENISSALYSIYNDDAKRESVLSWISRISNCEFTDIKFDFDINGDVIAMLEDSSSNITPVSSASDGTLRFIAILVKLHQIDENSMMFIEEIENGLHPTRVSYTMQMIDEISTLKNLRCCVTTHSPLAIIYAYHSNLDDKTFITFKDDKRGVTRLRKINSLPNIHNALQFDDIGKLFYTGWMEDAIHLTGRE